jgi:hypothetical protein
VKGVTSYLTPVAARGALFGLSLLAAYVAWTAVAPPGVTVTFVYTPDADALVKPLIERYNREQSRIHVVGMALASGDAEQRISGKVKPQLQASVWMPATSLWNDMLNSDTAAESPGIGTGQSVVKSPVVIAMWPEVARRFDQPVEWLSLVGSSVAGSRNGEPFRFGLTNVDSSTSGLFAAISIYAAYARKIPSALSPDDVDRSRAQVKTFEQSLAPSRYLARARDFCGPLSEFGQDVASAVYMQETTLVECNNRLRAAGKQMLEGLYPSHGVFVADYPDIVLSRADWVRKRKGLAEAARKFDVWLRNQVATVAAQQGYRLPDSFTSPPPGGVPGAPETTIEPPGPEIIAIIRWVWRDDAPRAP